MNESNVCPSCGSKSYQTHQEQERLEGELVTYTFFSECSRCGYINEGDT